MAKLAKGVLSYCDTILFLIIVSLEKVNNMMSACFVVTCRSLGALTLNDLAEIAGKVT